MARCVCAKRVARVACRNVAVLYRWRLWWKRFRDLDWIWECVGKWNAFGGIIERIAPQHSFSSTRNASKAGSQAVPLWVPRVATTVFLSLFLWQRFCPNMMLYYFFLRERCFFSQVSVSWRINPFPLCFSVGVPSAPWQSESHAAARLRRTSGSLVCEEGRICGTLTVYGVCLFTADKKYCLSVCKL